MQLLSTTKTGKGKASHKHFTYIDLSNQQAPSWTSYDKDHMHNIEYEQETLDQTDPISGVVLLPGTSGGWKVRPGGQDNHTHEIGGEIELSMPETEYEDTELVSDTRELYKVSKDIETEAYKDAEQAEDFYMGEQWKRVDKEALEGVGRAALTINEIESKMDLLSGYQRQNRSDFKFLPLEEGDARVADIFTAVVKNICDRNDYEFAETDVFDDMSITGRGNIHCYIDYDTNPMGEIKIEHFPWRDVSYGPHNKKDGSDAEYSCKAKWMSLHQVETLWPEKKGDIQQDWELWGDPVTGGSGSGDKFPDVGDEKKSPGRIDDLPSYVNIARKEYRVIEVERKERYRVPVIFDTANNFFMSGEGISKADVESIKTLPVQVVESVVVRIRRTAIAGNVLLDDDYLDDEDFTVLPAYAKKRANYYWGKVATAIGMQEEINKRHSQFIDIVNKVAVYGYFYDDQTFQNKADLQAFKDQASKPGFVLPISDVTKPPLKQEGVKVPAELAAVMDIDSRKVKEIMNINIELEGQSRASQSGTAIMQQKQQGLVGNHFLFDNLNLMKKRLGRKIIRLVQKCYTPERILRIIATTNAATPGGMQVAGQNLMDHNPEEIKAALMNTDLTKYDLAVSESPYNATNRLANFLIWADLKAKGAPVPLLSLVDMSDAPDKEKMKQAIQQEMQMEQATAQQKNQTEIIKTQIAHAGKQQQAPAQPRRAPVPPQ